MTTSIFQTRTLPARVDEIAPDGSEIRHLCRSDRASLVHVMLKPGQVSRAVTHRSVEELWYFVSGHGELWRSRAGHQEVVAVSAGVAVTVPVGTTFQCRAGGSEALTAVCCTVPPWPGDDEAEPSVGPWAG